MKKRLLLLLIICLLINGCSFRRIENSNDKVTLEKQYYKQKEYIESNSDEINKLLKDEKSFVLFTYNNYCAMSIPCDEIFAEYMDNNKIAFLSLPFSDFKKTKLYEKIKYAPSVIIIDKGQIKAYLDANKDEDINKYQNVKDFSNWFNQYVNI